MFAGSLVIDEPTPSKEGEETKNLKPLRAALDNAKRVILFDSVEILRASSVLAFNLFNLFIVCFTLMMTSSRLNVTCRS